MVGSAIAAIRTYVDNLMSEPLVLWPHRYFEQQSYSRWAANEILSYVLHHLGMSPITAVEEFANLMDEYSCKNQFSSFGFSVAHDVAMDILDMLLAM